MKHLLVPVLVVLALPCAWFLAAHLSPRVVDRREETFLVLETAGGFTPERVPPGRDTPPDGSVLVGGIPCHLLTQRRRTAVSLILRHLGSFHQAVH